MNRVIFLVDMNAFYIACEMTRHPELKGVPAAVAGDPRNRSGIILSPNYDARAYGVRTTMLLHQAKKLCPEIVFVPPEHGFYEYMSKETMAILHRYAPVMQQNSIDEAWLDLTGCELVLGKPHQVAENIMHDILTELDLWCSIGISENKFLSKMASEIKKPLGITELWKKDVPQMLWPLPVREMYGIGGQTEKKLHTMSIRTIGDIAQYDKNLLIRQFGKYGEELHLLANGEDHTPVDNHAHSESKSISRSTTLAHDVSDFDHLATVLLGLAEEVGFDARHRDYRGRTVSIVLKFNDFQTITRQRSIPPTNLTKVIYSVGLSLLQDNWDRKRPIRLIGIGINGNSDTPVQQLSMFELIDEDHPAENAKEEKLEKALDAIKDKYGTDSVKRAKLL